MSVRIRMKKLGRAHRPYFRICAVDKRAPRDGRVLEELGTYDPMIRETDARAVLKAERIDYWLGVGAQPSEKVAVLIKKYGTGGTHIDAQKSALEKMAQPRAIPSPGKPASSADKKAQQAAEAAEGGGSEEAKESDSGGTAAEPEAAKTE